MRAADSRGPPYLVLALALSMSMTMKGCGWIEHQAATYEEKCANQLNKCNCCMGKAAGQCIGEKLQRGGTETSEELRACFRNSCENCDGAAFEQSWSELREFFNLIATKAPEDQKAKMGTSAGIAPGLIAPGLTGGSPAAAGPDPLGLSMPGAGAPLSAQAAAGGVSLGTGQPLPALAAQSAPPALVTLPAAPATPSADPAVPAWQPAAAAPPPAEEAHWTSGIKLGAAGSGDPAALLEGGLRGMRQRVSM